MKVPLRRCVCCQEKINKCRKVAYFRAFCKVDIIREALRKARLYYMETYLLLGLIGENLSSRRITVGFSEHFAAFSADDDLGEAVVTAVSFVSCR